ncbi:MAG: RluA family pseudouridine synthase [Spirochaetes bacterium]|nr:MAG: RluA family pseudouridine synthase [Spirochaetota bacterium]
MNSEQFHVQIPGEQTIRVDSFVASLGLFSRSQISKRSVSVRNLSGEELKFSRRLKDGDAILLEWDNLPSSEINPEPLNLNVVYEDENCIVIDKAQGVVVHPAYGHTHGTLVQGLLYRCNKLETAFGGDRIRPGIVHRLDKDTSGLIIAAKNTGALEFLSAQFRDRSVKKTYLAVIRGAPPFSEGEIEEPIGRDPRDRKKFTIRTRNAKYALTRYRILSESRGFSLIQLRILTGRTHQIRVHLQSIGCPVLGDPIYSRKNPAFPDASLMLHSWKLAIQLPEIGKKRFSAVVPNRFSTILSELGIEYFNSLDSS